MVAAWQSIATAAGFTGGDAVVNKPSGTVDGDLLIAYGFSTSGTLTAPAGWTTHPASLGTANPLWTKTAASEPANYTFDNTAGSAVVTIVRVNGHHPTAPIDVASGVTVAGTGSGALDIPSVTPTGPDRLLLQMVSKNNSTTFTPPGTATERWDQAGTGIVTAGGDEVVGAGATGIRTWTPATGTSKYVGYMVAIRSAAPPTVEIFDTPGTFTGGAGGTGWLCPANVTSVEIECYAGGGGGGRGGGTSPGRGGGGGEWRKSTRTVVPGTIYAFSVGAGGLGGVGASSPTVGGDSTFDTNVIVAKGGGFSTSGGGGAGGTGGTGDTGFAGAAGQGNVAGGGDGGAAGGPAGSGTGGAGGTGAVTTGFPGTQPGGGGEGGIQHASQYSGGNGGNGRVIFTYTAAAPSNTGAFFGVL